jgi:hypothetical protein
VPLARLALLLLLPACTGGHAVVRSDPGAARRTTSSRLQGVWDRVQETVDPDGDRRIERLEWHLHDRGGWLHGFVHRSLTWRSGDSVPFRCTGHLQATRSWRSVVEGPLGPSGRTAELRWVSSTQDASSCGAGDSVPAIGERCRLSLLSGARLRADCGAGELELGRRLELPVSLDLAIHGREVVTGIWTWHHRSIDAEGDTKVEAETWRLEQRGSGVRGHYERLVVVRSGDGRRFQCNNALQYTNESRFEIVGKVEGRRLRIRELSFRARPNRCETGTRTLDEYEGELATDGRVIRLSWGRGAQLLYRRF